MMKNHSSSRGGRRLGASSTTVISSIIFLVIALVHICYYNAVLTKVLLSKTSSPSPTEKLLSQYSSPSENVKQSLKKSNVQKAIDDTTKNSYRHNQSARCSKDVSPILFTEWRHSKENICSSNDNEVSIEQFRLDRWEYKPTVTVYNNVVVNNIYDNIKTTNESCEEIASESNTLRNDTFANTTEINHPVIRVKTFDTSNAYERFHSIINTGMVMAMLNITNPQLIYLVSESEMRNHIMISKVVEIWSSLSTLKPIVVELSEAGRTDFNSDQPKIALPYVVDFFYQGTSIMVTRTDGSLRGRGLDHHCKSVIFRGINDFIRTNLGIGNESRDDNVSNSVQVLWSSRGAYFSNPDTGEMYTPSRSIANEQKLVQAVQNSLGSHYNITMVNFGVNMTSSDSVKAAYNAHILVGVHGAGLVWSSFMKPHTGLLEMFGGDRGRINRHYHNIASLADLHYRSLTLRSGGKKSLIWDERSVNEIVQKIKSINFDEEPGADEP